MAKRKRKSAREIFEENEGEAAMIIVELMKSDSSSNSLKADLAKEVLTRLYGKTFENAKEEEGLPDLPEFYKELSK